jgi:hypothetical protein
MKNVPYKACPCSIWICYLSWQKGLYEGAITALEMGESPLAIRVANLITRYL